MPIYPSPKRSTRTRHAPQHLPERSFARARCAVSSKTRPTSYTLGRQAPRWGAWLGELLTLPVYPCLSPIAASRPVATRSSARQWSSRRCLICLRGAPGGGAAGVEGRGGVGVRPRCGVRTPEYTTPTSLRKARHTQPRQVRPPAQRPVAYRCWKICTYLCTHVRRVATYGIHEASVTSLLLRESCALFAVGGKDMFWRLLTTIGASATLRGALRASEGQQTKEYD